MPKATEFGGIEMLKNDQLDRWDRQNSFYTSAHLPQHTHGDSPTQIIKTAKWVLVRIGMAIICSILSQGFTESSPPLGVRKLSR